VKKPAPGKRPLKTLERVLSKAGLGSRTDARKWIAAGRVKVNGKLIQTPDHWVDLVRDKVTLDGKPVRAAEKIYLLLYKPAGYITTFKDPEGRATVYDLIRPVIEGEGRWVVPVGRLDQDTSGLLLLTSDTRFAEHVTNPDSKVPKTYLVKASTILSDDQLQQLRSGVMLSDGPTQPAQVKRVRDSAKYSFIEITIQEGRNRQVRRMLEAIGSKVLKLVRVQIGSLRIGDLPIGHYRALTPAEVALLVNGTGSQTRHQRARMAR
jgi:23S rRNA pseudouridine2605 synthase